MKGYRFEKIAGEKKKEKKTEKKRKKLKKGDWVQNLFTRSTEEDENIK